MPNFTPCRGKGEAVNRQIVRKSNVLVAVCMLLAACAGSTESTSSSVAPRAKNAELLREPAACTSGNIGPNGGFVLGEYQGKIVEGAPTAWSTSLTDGMASQKSALDYAATFSLNGKTGWSIPEVEVYQALKDAIHTRYGVALYWSSTKWTPTLPILMNSGGRTDFHKSYFPTVNVVPLILTASTAAACSTIVTTTTSTSTTSTTSTTTTTTTTTIPKPTTTTIPFVPVTCTTSSLSCRIGDTGPGGGIVVASTEVRDDNAVSIRFTEIAPAGWDGRQDPMEGARSNALQKVNSYSGGGKSDWRVPTGSESRAICRGSFVPPSTNTEQCLTQLGFGGMDYGGNVNFVYWTNENLTTKASSNRTFDYKVGGDWNGDNRTPRIRPARSWDVVKVSLVVPTTAKPTTTTTQPMARTWSIKSPEMCIASANCKVGDTGPGGGVIIQAEKSGMTASYVEIAPSGWASTSTDQDPLLSATDARSEALKYRGGGFSDWTMPAEWMITRICHVAAGRSPDSQGACSDNPSIGKEFGSGNSVRNQELYWNGNSNTARFKTDFISGRNTQDSGGKAYLRPVRSYSYVPPTTTTTIPKTCADGGKCAVGDISPSGNLIIFIEDDRGSISYTEIAPRNWGASLMAAGQTGDPELIRATAVNEATRYGPRGTSGWAVPTVEQMSQVFVFFAQPKFDASCRDTSTVNRTLTPAQQPFRLGSLSYWITDPTQRNRSVALETASGAVYFDAQRYLSPWGYKDGSDVVKRGVRPVRTVRYTGPPMDVAKYVWSPTKCERTSPPTTTATTLPATCVQRGQCRVGDVGPHGGIIISVNRAVADGPQYTEMATTPNNRSDCAGTSFASRCVMREWDDGTYRTPFGSYPTPSELVTVARSNALRSVLKLKSSPYWTNRWIGRSGVLGGDFNGNLGELAQSLEVQKFEEAIAVNMANGSPRVTSIAYFRGVIRWNCQRACVNP